jgi:glycerol-3-phosphate dehydrogenase (NAD(P)+)
VIEHVAILGAGSWGTAVAANVAANAQEVVLWCHTSADADAINTTHANPRHLSGVRLPDNVRACDSIAEALKGMDAAILAVPSQHLRGIAHEVACAGFGGPLLVLTKGIERDTGLIMSDVVAEEIEQTSGATCLSSRIAVLSGPNHAEEVSQSLISACVIASATTSVAEDFRDLFSTPNFRCYVSDDVTGVEVCAAIKNVIALACGMAVGSGCGDNALAAIMTRGLAEMGRMVTAMGGDPMTCMGLAGMGDLVATCTSPHSRNRTFGEAFVGGESLAEFEARTSMVVEGARAAVSVRSCADRLSVQIPITRVVCSILYDGMTLDQAVDLLMGRSSKHEFYDIS